MADVAVAYTLVTPAGTIVFNDGATDQFYIGEIQGLEGAPVRAPMDDRPWAHGGLVYPFWEGPRHMVFDGIFLIQSTWVGDQVVTIRNQMEETLRTCLRSLLQADGTLTWQPQGQASRTLTVRNDVTYDSTHTDNYVNESFHFGLVAADPDWDGFVSAPTWSQVFAARSGVLGVGSLLTQGWLDSHDYAADLIAGYAPWGTGSGILVQFLQPTGFTDIFASEVDPGNTTDSVEPDWASVPNVGDSIGDNILTWFNYGPVSDWPQILAWATNTNYPGSGPASAVIPSVANGHVYVEIPQSFSINTTAVTEPTFPTNGDIVSDGGGFGFGFWLDVGPVP